MTKRRDERVLSKTHPSWLSFDTFQPHFHTTENLFHSPPSLPLHSGHNTLLNSFLHTVFLPFLLSVSIILALTSYLHYLSSFLLFHPYFIMSNTCLLVIPLINTKARESIPFQLQQGPCQDLGRTRPLSLSAKPVKFPNSYDGISVLDYK